MRWDEEIINAAGVPASMLPEIMHSGEVVGRLLPGAAEELGLSETTLVISGAHDQYAAATGALAHEPGDMLLSTGTAWVLTGITDQLVFDYEDYLGVGNHALQGMFGVLTSIPTAGAGMEWFRKNFAEPELGDGMESGCLGLLPQTPGSLEQRSESQTPKVSFSKIDGIAGTRIEQDAGLYFYPQFIGAGFPRWTPKSKASFMGLSLEHDSYDMALTIMEGVAFDVALRIEAYAAKGFPCKQLKMLGGASKSRLWTDIIRYVTGLPIARFKEADMACKGAAAFAAAACGMFPDARTAARVMAKDSIELLEAPSGNLREHYIRKYKTYKERLPIIEEFYL
jgi:sugar (pentulose or hexulose) kinase